jgi:hypothetical protein
MMQHQPSWRKPAGMLLILLGIALWVGLIASFSAQIARLPQLAQGLIYVTAGLVWIFPMRPILVWMETGRWRG